MIISNARPRLPLRLISSSSDLAESWCKDRKSFNALEHLVEESPLIFPPLFLFRPIFSLFQLRFKDIFHHDKQTDGSSTATIHPSVVFLVDQVEEKFQIETFRHILHFLSVSDFSQSMEVDALMELHQSAMRIAQFHYGCIGNA